MKRKWQELTRTQYIQIVILASFSLIVGFGFAQFNDAIEDFFEEKVQNLLIETTANQKLLFQTRLESQIHTLEVLSQQIGFTFTSFEQLTTELQGAKAVSSFDDLGIIDRDGVVYSTDETGVNVSEREYFQQAIAGQAVISQPLIIKTTGKPGIVSAVPLEVDGEIIGVIYGTNTLATLTFELTSPSFSGESYGYIVNQEGTIIANINTPAVANNMNLFALISDVKINNQPVEEALAQQLLEQGNGFVTYEREGKRIAYYQSLEFNDWLILGVVPQADVEMSTDFIGIELAWLIAKVLLLVLALIAYIVDQSKRNQRLVQQQLAWTKMSEMKYRIAIEQADNLIFEYFVPTNHFVLNEHIISALELTPAAEYTPESLVKTGLIVPEATKEWLHLFQQIRDGVPKLALTTLLQIGDQPLQWYDIYLTAIFDDEKRPQRVIGKLVNVDAQREYTKQLIAHAKKDSLTGLYNKRATQEKIDTILKHSTTQRHVLFVIDIDDFKAVNDQFGHYVGDQVIYEVAQFLQTICRETDVVGRIGGDEFIIFLYDIHKSVIVERKAAEICQAFKHYYLPQQHHKISGSVGVVSVESGEKATFQSLYTRADTAMYEAKKSGKDRYCISK